MYDLSISSTLEGVTGNILLEERSSLEDVKIVLNMAKKTFDDIPVVQEWQRMSWNMFSVVFSFNRPDFYNFYSVPLMFQIVSGSVIEDIHAIFSIVQAAQDFSSYILQKTYSVASEINGNTDLEISDWNVYPNKTWYVLVDGLNVTLYDTEADMLATTNPVATGEADPDSLEVFLTYVDEYEGDVAFYYQDFTYHLILSDIVASRKFCIKPFTDMGEIRHPIYNNSNIVLSRGEAELNLHTFTVLGRELALATHIPEMEVGEVVDFTSTRRNVSQKSQILSQTISGEMGNDGSSSLINTIRVANYMELFRR